MELKTALRRLAFFVPFFVCALFFSALWTHVLVVSQPTSVRHRSRSSESAFYIALSCEDWFSLSNMNKNNKIEGLCGSWRKATNEAKVTRFRLFSRGYAHGECLFTRSKGCLGVSVMNDSGIGCALPKNLNSSFSAETWQFRNKPLFISSARFFRAFFKPKIVPHGVL